MPGPTPLAQRLGRTLPAAGLILICALAWWLVHGGLVARVHQAETLGEPVLMRGAEPDAPSALGPYALFWSEAAFHYRVALMFARDDYQDPSLLHRDTWQQHPEGVDAWREYALAMEPIYGGLYRGLGRPGGSFLAFLLVLIPLIHAATIVPAFRLARVLGVSPGPALVGALAYALCPLAFTAILTAILVKETFSLLLLAGFLALHADAWQRGGALRTAGAAAVLAAFLVSWHLAQFLAALVLAAAAAAAAIGPRPASPQDRRIAWSLPAAYVAAAVVAGLSPALRARGFLYGPTLVPLWAWVAVAAGSHLVPAWGARRTRRLLLLLGASAVAAAVAVLAAPHGDYGHVSGLLVAELRHHFVKPADPAALPFAVRLFWAVPYTPPALGRVWLQTGTVLVVLAPALVWRLVRWRRAAGSPPRLAFNLTVVAFLAAWLLSERLGAVFLLLVPALVGAAVQAAAGCVAACTRRPAWAAALVGTVAAVVVLANLPWRLGGLAGRAWAATQGRPAPALALDHGEDEDRAAVYRWITSHTPGPGSSVPGAPAVFAADIGLSPQLLLYAGRPVVLNSQFENEAIRRRWQAWLTAFFAPDEGPLLTLAAQQGVDYVVIDRDLATAAGRWSRRYAAGRTGPPALDTLAARMHFDPERLRGLGPVYDNGHYRVLKIRRAGEPDPPWQRGHGRWWDPASFRQDRGVLSAAAADRDRLARLDRDLRRCRGRLDALAHRQGALLAAVMERRRDPSPDAADAADALLARPDPESGATVGAALAAILDGAGPDAPGLLALLDAGVPEPGDLEVAAAACRLAGRHATAALAERRLARLRAGDAPGS